MKRLLVFACLVVFFSLPAFAAKNSQTIDLSQSVTVGSTQLPVGHYKVTWTGSGPSVQVTLKQEGVHAPAIATVRAKLVDQNHERASVVFNRDSGVISITEIQLNHVSLVLSAGPNTGQ